MICNRWIAIFMIGAFLPTKSICIEIPKKRDPIIKNKEDAGSSFATGDSIHFPEGKPLPFIIRKLQRPVSYLSWSKNLFTISNPPVNSSHKTQLELDYLEELQKRRSPEIVKEILEFDRFEEDEPLSFQWEAGDFRGPFAVGNFLGKKFRRSKMPLTRVLVNKTIGDIETICYQMKYAFNRPRPNQLRPQIKSALNKGLVPPHPSYPAGHSCVGYGTAELFSKLAPAKKEKFFAKADEIAVSREWAGIHFPSDSEAARELVSKFFVLIAQNQQFQKDFSAATAEWKHFQ